MANDDDGSVAAPEVLADHVVGVLAMRILEADPDAPVGEVVIGPWADAAGREVFDETADDEPLGYLHGQDNLLPPIEEALAGKRVGDELSVTLAPEDTFGPAREDAGRIIPVDAFPDDAPLAAGLEFVIEMDDGENAPAWVIDIDGSSVRASLNHPLAGLTLTFQLKVLSMREARPDELEHGHPHPDELEHGHPHPGGEHEVGD